MHSSNSSCQNKCHSCLKKSIFDHMKSLLVTVNQFLCQEINFCDKKQIPVTRYQVLKHVTWNQFLWQEINFCEKKSILVKRNQQHENPNKNLAWAYLYFVGTCFQGSLWISCPGRNWYWDRGWAWQIRGHLEESTKSSVEWSTVVEYLYKQ